MTKINITIEKLTKLKECDECKNRSFHLTTGGEYDIDEAHYTISIEKNGAFYICETHYGPFMKQLKREIS